MKLEEALRKTIRQFGVSALQEKRLLFILSDFRAFNDHPAVKQVFQSIVSDGSGKKLCSLFLDDDSEGCLSFAGSLKKSLAEDRHFKQELADYAVDSITFAMGLQTTVREPSDHGFDPMDEGNAEGRGGADTGKQTVSVSRAESTPAEVRVHEQPHREEPKPAGSSSGSRDSSTVADAQFSDPFSRPPLSDSSTVAEAQSDTVAVKNSSPFRMKWLAVLVLIAGAFAFGKLSSGGSGKPEPVQVQPATDIAAVSAAEDSAATKGSSSARDDEQSEDSVSQSSAGTGQAESDADRESEALALGNRYFNESNFAEAAEYYRKAAEFGNADAELALGWLYENGKGVGRNYSEAVKWYRKAADQGEPVAQGNLATMYYNGHGVTRNYSEALKWFHKAADQGNTAAYSWLGSMYYSGQGTSRNYAEALRWFRKAADQRNTDVYGWLGIMNFNGQGTSRNYGEALKWFRKDAERGSADAQNYIGWMYQNGLGVMRDNAEAVNWYRKAASGGSASGQINLGWMYETGTGVRQDNAEALLWYRKAAGQGNADAKERVRALSGSMDVAQSAENSSRQGSYASRHVPEYDRAEMYFYGRGVTQDYAEAMRLYREAAAEGDDRAYYSLGWMYQNGLGVSQSLSEAASWYRKAAAHGNTDANSRLVSLDQTPVSYTPASSSYVASSGSQTLRSSSYDGPSDPDGQFALGERFFYGRGVPQDYGEAFSWYGKAAGSGNADAMYSLGWMYQNGLGVSQSLSEAVRWYRMSAANGNTDAVSRLRSLDSW